MVMTKKNVTYVADIIEKEEEVTGVKINVAELPIINVENVEVRFSTLNSATPISGHSLTVIIPKDNNFLDKDKVVRNGMLKIISDDNPDIETILRSYRPITEARMLESQSTKTPFTEQQVGGYTMTFNVTNAVICNDRTNKSVSKLADLPAGDTATVRYYRVNDKFSGKGINPTVFRFNDKGEKVTTYVSPKDHAEKLLFMSKGDIVNLRLRPYLQYSQKDDKYTTKYNLLSVEIVQTAYERNGGKTKSTRPARQIENKYDFSGLANLFGSVEEVETPKEKTVAKKATKQTVEEKKEVSEEIPFNEGLKEEKKTETKATTDDKSTDDMWADLEKEFNI